MPLSQVRNVVGGVATAAVLYYSYIGAPSMTPVDFSRGIDLKVRIPDEMSFDYYQAIDKDEKTASRRQIEVIHRFASNLLENIKDLDPEFSKTVDENFWDLI